MNQLLKQFGLMQLRLKQLVFGSALLGVTAVCLSPALLTPAHAQSGGKLSRPAPLPSGSVAPGGGGNLAKYEPAEGVYHGASLPGTWEPGSLRAQLSQYTKYSGKRLAVITWYASVYENGRMSSWRNEYMKPLRYVKDAGALSLIKMSFQDSNFNSTRKIASTKQVAAGVYDNYFVEAANTVRDFGGPVFISMNHEMNGTWYPFSQDYPGSGVTAQDYINSWRHVVDIFRKQGANNVAWVWSPNVPDVGSVPFTGYYPGDDYVDWVGVSFYSGNPMSNLQTIYKAYAAKKPIFITEWATGEDKNQYYQGFPGEATWVGQFFASLERNYPRVKAISWFQWDKRQYGESDYTLQRDSGQVAQYQVAIRNPRYLDTPGSLVPAGNGIASVPLEVVPNEIVLREVVPVRGGIRAPAQAPVRQAPPVQQAPVEQVRTERPRLKIVPREQVVREQ